MDDDIVFKALSDPNRRILLDALFKQDGQSLNELCEHLEISRFGVMKHLGVLADARLITAEKVGREKHHYLNPIPIQVVYERWVNKYAQPWAQTLTGLKHIVEESTLPDKHVMQIFIQATPERLWHALTSSEMTRQYYFGSDVVSDWQVGSPYHYPNPAGGNFVEGEIVECEPPHKLVMTFRPVFQYPDGDVPETRVTWLIDPDGTACKLTLTHEGLSMTDANTAGLIEGWSRITSGLKTLLETGEPLNFDA